MRDLHLGHLAGLHLHLRRYHWGRFGPFLGLDRLREIVPDLADLALADLGLVGFGSAGFGLEEIDLAGPRHRHCLGSDLRCPTSYRKIRHG